MSVPITVTALALAPVKGARVCAVDEVGLGPRGAAGDRAFLVVDHDDVLLETTRTPALLAVEPAWEPERRVLALRFPDGSEVRDVVAPGAPARTRLYDGRGLRGRRVDGPLAGALSAHLGRPVRLLVRDEDETGADDAPVTLMSGASLRALAAALAQERLDPRRFRMTMTVEGVEAFEEHGWTGRELAIGEVVLRVTDPVPRCVVTTRDPERGRRDAPVLKALAQLRGKRDVSFGVWCEVVAPGRVRVGDNVHPRGGVAGSPSM